MLLFAEKISSIKEEMFSRSAKFLIFLIFWSLLPAPFSEVHPLPKDPGYPLAKAALASKTLTYLHRYYYAPERMEPSEMFEAALFAIQRAVVEVLARCEKGKFCAVTVNQAVKRFAYPTEAVLAARLRDVLGYLERHVDADTEKREIEYAAIAGILDAMDPHSNFMSPESYKEFRVGTEGEFGGLGIVISIKEGRLTVTSPIEGTPAWRAAMKANDHILQIDEESTINMDLTEAVARLRGRPGTKVTLKVEREGKKEPFSVAITRAIIHIESVQSQLVQTEKKRAAGYIKVKNFQSNTRSDVLDHLKKMHQKNPQMAGLILDLRNNPGGLLDQAVLLADLFLKEGTIVSTRGKGGRLMDQRRARDDGLEKEWPLIVLVNEGSASASEIVAGALKNNERALIVGATTFGKGTVQSIYELPRAAAVKITVGQYYTPGEVSIQSIGITPDIALAPVKVDTVHLDTIDNIRTFEKDLEKHLTREQVSLEKPKYVLRYLEAVSEDDQEMREYSTKLELEKDTAATVALAMMDVLTSGFRPAMLEEIAPLVEKTQKGETAKIVEAFAKLNIDWKEGKASGTPQAQLSYSLLQDGKPLSKARAGGEVTLKIELKNAGEGPFFRLAAQTDSKIYPFKNFEFAFGKVAPQETRAWAHTLKIPMASPTEEIPLQLQFSELNGRVPPPVEILLPIEGLQDPLFAHRFSLDAGAFEKLKAGKTIDLNVEVLNTGEGASAQTVVALKNLGGKEVFIEKGREVLKDLKPGKKERVRFRLHLDPEAAAGEIRLELSIVDADLFVRSGQEMVLNLASQTTLPASGQWFYPPKITLAGKRDKVTKESFSLQGEAKDDEKVRDLFIFVGEDKTYYEANAEASARLKFKAPLTLQEGNNMILITARDNHNLMSTRRQVIRYEPEVVQKGAL